MTGRGFPAIRLNVLAVCAAVAGAGAWALLASGSGLADVSRYFLVWALIVVLPGVLLWRAMAGHSRMEIELGAGAATGISLLLLSWIVATAVGHPRWSAAAPVAVIMLFLCHPRLRTHWRPERRRHERSSPLWLVSVGILALLAIYQVSLSILRPSRLPPGPSALASDTWYSLGIAQQLSNGFPVADPTFLGGEIKYHWFSLGVITATSQLAGTDLVATLVHLWFVPFVVVWLLVVSALVRTLLKPYETASGRAGWWGWGPIAAALVVVFPAAVLISSSGSPGLGNGLNSSSASGAFGGLFVTALAVPVIEVLRGDRRPGMWAALVLLVLASAGMKPTVLPLVAAGCGVAFVVAMVRRDRGRIVAFLIAGLAVLVAAIAGRIVIGSSEGVKIQPFALLVADGGYQALFGSNGGPLAGAGGFVLPALAEQRPGAVVFVASVTLLFVFGQAFRLLGVVMLPWSPMRRDLAGWWCAGTVVAAYTITFLVAHNGLSQQWFAFNVSGVSVALTMTALALVWPEHLRRSSRVWAVATIGAGVVVGAVGPLIGQAQTEAGQRPTLTARLLPFGVALAVLALWLGVRAFGAARRRHPWGGPSLSALGAFALVTLFVGGAVLPGATSWLRRGQVRPITSNPGAVVTADEQAAAVWLNRNSAPDDVVIGNVFCRPPKYRPNCDHSTVWASALTGRRFVLDGWTYIPATAAKYDGTQYMGRIPSPFPERLQLSLAVVRDPTPELMCDAVKKFGVKWVFADHRATVVSQKLSTYASERFSAGTVSIYEIDQHRLECSKS
ncbi:MAG: hypothetical protein ABI112_18675 [Terracoccus sp.]